jgi:uncharacterized membrane protein
MGRLSSAAHPRGGSLDAAPSRTRFDRLDALRAVAILWMAGFHFGFDLNHFGFIRQNFYNDPFWTVQRSCIVSLFLFCAGMGQAVAIEQAQDWARFWRRWVQVAACAVLVSAGSWWMFPRSFISFGVLHCIALLLITLRLTHRAGRVLWVLGACAWAAPWVVQNRWFDTRWTNWIGLVTHKPVTEDYVPLLPWLTGPWPPALRPLAVLGRWSLTFYMVHQLVFFALLSGWRALWSR